MIYTNLFVFFSRFAYFSQKYLRMSFFCCTFVADLYCKSEVQLPKYIVNIVLTY